MFRPGHQYCGGDGGFPRIRGDVPASCSAFVLSTTFSPHTRGCSPCVTRTGIGLLVFPAYAGMFRLTHTYRPLLSSFPRIRGDVPSPAPIGMRGIWFSPHTRGCSERFGTFGRQNHVFPAYAGMFRDLEDVLFENSSFPRIRGDVPQNLSLRSDDFWFSPHTRGCSVFPYPMRLTYGVFPAYAGMFRFSMAMPPPTARFPRIRGDVPCTRPKRPEHDWFSPHTRGCSADAESEPVADHVFPAYAGMFRTLGY